MITPTIMLIKSNRLAQPKMQRKFSLRFMYSCLKSFVEVDDDPRGVAAEEDDDDCHEDARHRVLTPVSTRINCVIIN